MPTDPYLTTLEVSERLNIAVGTLRYWRLAGIGPQSVKLGPRQVRYRASEVAAYEQRCQSAEAAG